MFNKKKIISFLIILSLVLVSGQVALAKDKTDGANDKKTVVYTAIGDAIALGVGGGVSDQLKGYDEYLLEKLQADSKKKETVVLNNVSSRLDTSADLLNKLMNDQTVINAVKDADIITVSIGANNLILPVWPIFQQIFAGEISEETGIYMIFGKTAEFQAGVDQFKADWPKIVKRIEKLAPKAQIVATTMYNPFLLYHPLHDLADAYIKQINAEINNKSSKLSYEVADVYTKFDKYDLSYGYDFYDYYYSFIPEGYIPTVHQDLPDVVHPTPFGYQMISNLIYKQLN